MSHFGDDTRADLHTLVMGNGITTQQAHLVVGLACHAADKALRAVAEITQVAPNGPEHVMAFQIAAQLVRAVMDDAIEDLKTAAAGADLDVVSVIGPVRLSQ